MQLRENLFFKYSALGTILMEDGLVSCLNFPQTENSPGEETKIPQSSRFFWYLLSW